jgi:uracil-DNA glycosylase
LTAVDLGDVYEVIRDDDRWDHLRAGGIVLVPGRGNSVDPLAMLVGEAPGANENLQRRPFCGPSGRVLTQLMALAGLYAEPREYGDNEWSDTVGSNAFITNVVKYRPPGNRTPTASEVMVGVEALREEWKAVGRPRLIVAVGATARAALTPVELRLKPGNWWAYSSGQTFVWVQYHPAWGLRQGDRGRATMERQWEAMGKWIKENLT